MNYYSSGSQSSPYGRSDAYSRASRYRSRPNAVAAAPTSFDLFGTDFSYAFSQGRAKKAIFENAAIEAEKDLGDREHEHRLKMQKLTQDTQDKTYDIIKEKAEEAAKKQQRKNTGSSIGSLIGGGLGLLTGNPAGFAFGSQIGGFIGDQLG